MEVTNLQFHLLTTSKTGVEVFSVKYVNDKVELESVQKWEDQDVECAAWSPCGLFLSFAKKSSVRVYKFEDSFSELCAFDIMCEKLYFSASSSYLATFSICSDPTKMNLHVINLKSKRIQLSTHSKVLNIQEQGLPLVWTAPCELYCFRLISSCLNIYTDEITNDAQPIQTIQLERPVVYEVSKEKEDGSVNVAIFCASTSSVSGKIVIYSITKTENIITNSIDIAQVQRSRISWNYQGTLLLAVVYNDVDVSGKSYYGSSALYLLNVQTKENACLIAFKKGPISDFSWFPNTNDFAAIFGHVPPQITIFDGKTGKVKHSLGPYKRNTIRFNRFGRFMCLGGFGNFAGDLDVYDKYKKKIIGSSKAEYTVDCEWGPDGRILLCSTTTPRMRVDNCIKIFRYNGDLLCKLNFDTLYSSIWRPCPNVAFKDRQASRGRKNAMETIEKPKVYRPPHLSQA